jgi:hypothetical protein
VKRCYFSGNNTFSVCQKCLAEFAPLGANKLKSVFSGGMYVRKNTSRLTSVRPGRPLGGRGVRADGRKKLEKVAPPSFSTFKKRGCFLWKQPLFERNGGNIMK